MKHMKVNGTNQKVYFQEDLDRIRRKMRIGDRIERMSTETGWEN